MGRDLVLTHDVLVEGVHYLPDDPAGDVAWKLLAVNLSDLAAKGAEPLGVLMGFTLAGDDAWDSAFLEGLDRALRHRSEEHTSELQSLMRISYAVFCLKKKTKQKQTYNHVHT